MRGVLVPRCTREGRCRPPAQPITLLSARNLSSLPSVGSPVHSFGQDRESDPWVLFPASREIRDPCLEQE